MERRTLADGGGKVDGVLVVGLVGLMELVELWRRWDRHLRHTLREYRLGYGRTYRRVDIFKIILVCDIKV